MKPYQTTNIIKTTPGQWTIFVFIAFENYFPVRLEGTITIHKTTEDINGFYMGKIYDTLVVSPSDITITTPINSGRTPSFTFYHANGNPVVTPGGLPVDAGDYYVIISLPETGTWGYSESGHINFSILPAEVIVEWDSSDLIYTGFLLTPDYVLHFPANIPSPSSINLFEWILFDDTLDPLYGVTSNTPFIITLISGNPNFVIVGDTSGTIPNSTNPYTYTISPKPIDIPVGIADLVFNNSFQKGFDFDATWISLSVVADNFKRDAGVYDIVVNLVDPINTYWAGSLGDTAPETVNFAIDSLELSMDLDVDGNWIGGNLRISPTPIPDQEHTGSQITPPVTVEWNAGTTAFPQWITLVEGVHFDLVYGTNINVSGHVQVISASADFTFDVTLDFIILGIDIITIIDANSTFQIWDVEIDPDSIVRYIHTDITTTRTAFDPTRVQMITKIQDRVTIEQFITQLENNASDLEFLDTGGSPIPTSNYSTFYMATGMTVVLKDSGNNPIDSLGIAVNGDVDGNGIINANDPSNITVSLNSGTIMDEYVLVAADVLELNLINANQPANITLYLNDPVANNIFGAFQMTYPI